CHQDNSGGGERLTACNFCVVDWRFGLGLGVTVKGVTVETGLVAVGAVGAIEDPIISILLETVSPENNDASAFALGLALLGIDGSCWQPGVGRGRGNLGTTDTLFGRSRASSISVLAKTFSGEESPEWSDTEA